MTLPERCEREVREFHEFLEGWMGGALPDEEGTFDRAESVLADPFVLTSPSGETRALATVLADVRRSHGVYAGSDPPFSIRIEAPETRFVVDDHCLLTYEEHQSVNRTDTARRSTVLFREAGDTPNGVEWCHLHETWTPEGAPEG